MFKKIIYLFAAFVILSGSLHSQSIVETNKNNLPFSFSNNSIVTKEDLSSRKKWEFTRLRDPYTNKIPANISVMERVYAKTLPTDKAMRLQKGSQTFASNTWTFRGPYNQGGRSRAVAVDIKNSNIVLAGGTTGGMWRSTDNGLNWKKVTPVQDTIQTVTCVVQDTRNGKTNIWYYGTGEYASNLELQDNGAGFTTFLGAGIYKSVDNGVTWTRLQSTAPNLSRTFVNPFQIVWNIAIDTSNHNQDIVYSAVYGAIYRSTNGGSSWTAVLENKSSIYTNVAVTSKGDVYAALSNNANKQGIWHSDDGANWTDITSQNFPTVFARIVIANTPSNSNLLYVLANTPGSGKPGSKDSGADDYHSLWKYDASSKQWTDLTNNLPDQEGAVAGYSSQSGYDMLIKVHPANPDFVIIGGTNLYRTTDGFTTKLITKDWIGGYATSNDVESYSNQHPDEHDIFFVPSNPSKVYSANDGGVTYTENISANPVVWKSMNNGFSTTQFYSVALDHATSNSPLIVGGMQDNGNMMNTTLTANASWTVLPYGGDGCISAVANGGSYIYFSTQNGNIMEGRLSDNKGALVRPKGATGFSFVTPYVLDRTDSKIIYVAAKNNIWRNSDVLSIPIGTENPTTVNWTQFTNIDTTSNISALCVTIQPAHTLYYGTSDGKLFKVLNADKDNPSSVEITSTAFPKGNISSIAVDPQDANNILIDFSNYNILSIFYSSDGGTNWKAVSGNLEQKPDGTGNGPSVRSVRILNLSGSKVYFAGTSTGLYSTAQLDGMSTTWIQQGSENIGMVDVETIDTRDLDGTVIVGTFGIGVYSSVISTTGVKEEENIPLSYSLSQNYPNPFNPSTIIKYTIPFVETLHAASQLVTLKVFDLLGKEVATLVNEEKSAGNYEVKFNSETLHATSLPSGIYFYTIKAGNFVQTKKMVLIK